MLTQEFGHVQDFMCPNLWGLIEREVLGAQDRGAAQDSLNFTSLPNLVW